MRRYVRVIGIAAAAATGAAGALFAFNWPQEQGGPDSFSAYFGQLRGGTISSSLIFKDNSEVRAADGGHILAIIGEHTNDYGWFESPLGNAVIVGHDDQRVTVYANLDEEGIPPELEESDTVAEGDLLGVSGNSGWQEGQSCLEFQVLDTKSAIAINPRMLMPRIESELPLETGGVSVDDSRGVTHYLINERNLQAGQYYIYKRRDQTAMPFRTLVSVNGATVERISFDTLREVNGRLCVVGGSTYPVELMYPDATRQLLGRITLPHGHVTLSITVIDMLGGSKSVTYNLEVN